MIVTTHRGTASCPDCSMTLERRQVAMLGLHANRIVETAWVHKSNGRRGCPPRGLR